MGTAQLAARPGTASRPLGPESGFAWRGAPADLRKAVQAQARGRLRRHGVHDGLRVSSLFLLDLVAVLAAEWALSSLREIVAWPILNTLLPPAYLGGMRFAVPLTLSLIVVGAYRRGDPWRSPWLWLKGASLATALALWQFIWVQPVWLTAVQFALTAGGVTLVLAVSRGLLALTVLRMRGRLGEVRRAIIVGPAQDVFDATLSPIFSDPGGYAVAGHVVVGDDENERVAMALVEAILERDAHAVFIAGSLDPALLRQVVEVANNAGCEATSVSSTLKLAGVAAVSRVYGGVPLTVLTRPGLKAHQLVVKRLLDLTASALLLVLCAPLMVLIAIAVKVSSPGPVIFRQKRVGLGGRRFWILKFRSMREDAEQVLEKVASSSIYGDKRLFKMPDDPRITPIGKWLRKSSLDELPQLINVLIGQMSLVGPRPPLPSEVELYESHHLCRFDVRPGITGPWQVAGRNLVRDFDQVVLLEKRYIHGWSLVSDLRILLRTIPVVLKGTGAH